MADSTTSKVDKTKLLFATIADLQSYLEALDAKAAAAKAHKPAERKPSDEEKKQQDFLNQAKEELTRKVEKKKDFVKSPPLFKKPAFYLDYLTPVLNVDLVILFQNRKTLNDLPQEQRFRIFGETNNHLLSFKYDVGGSADAAAAGGAVELVFIDPKQEITEYLAMQLASLQTVLSGGTASNNPTWMRLEIEFGWAHNPDYVPKGMKNWDKIVFTNKIIVVVQTLETKFNNLGLPESTIKGYAENISSIAFKGASPYEVLGPYPATTLCFEEINRLFSKVFDKLDKNWSNIASRRSAVQQMGFLLFTRGLLDDKLVGDIIESAVKYYGKDADHITYQILNRSIIDSVVNSKLHHINPKYIDKFDLMKEVVGIKPPELKAEIGKSKTINSIISPDNNDVPLYHTEYRSIIDGEITLAPENRLFTNYFVKTGTAIHNCFKIHPYFLYKYVSNYITTQLNKGDQDARNTYIEFWDFDVDMKNMLLPPEYFDAMSQNKPYNFRKTHGGKPEEEPYFINTVDVALTLGYSWESLLNLIFSKMYVKYVPTDRANPGKGLQFELDDADKKNYEANQRKFFPLPLKSHVFFCDGKTARKNIDVWIQALEYRKKYLEETVQKKNPISGTLTSNDPRVKIGGSPKLSSVDKLIKDARAQRDLIVDDEDEKYLVNMVTVKISAAAAFGVDIGSQQIAQVYSYRIGNTYADNTMFNPGEPTCWEVNFPDVISADFNYDFFQAARSVASGARIVGSADRGAVFIASQAQTEKAKLLKEASDTAQARQKSATGQVVLKTTLSDNEKKKLQEILDRLNALDPSTKLGASSSAHTSAYPINVNVQDYSHSRVYSGDYYNMLERKREIQNIRASLIMTKTPITCDLEVIGDPTFAFANATNYWTFFKVINLDGTLSIFTGLYHIEGCTHEITAGKYSTKYKLKSDYATDNGISPDYSAQMQTIIYGSDKQKAYMGE